MRAGEVGVHVLETKTSIWLDKHAFLAHLPPILSHFSLVFFFFSSPRTANMNGSAKGHNRHVYDTVVLLGRQQTEHVRSMYGCRALVWKKGGSTSEWSGVFLFDDVISFFAVFDIDFSFLLYETIEKTDVVRDTALRRPFAIVVELKRSIQLSDCCLWLAVSIYWVARCLLFCLSGNPIAHSHSRSRFIDTHSRIPAARSKTTIEPLPVCSSLPTLRLCK
ncbi:hypothetical protein IWZ01DRAFT_221492 [Phyllosticta capitalensis]